MRALVAAILITSGLAAADNDHDLPADVAGPVAHAVFNRAVAVYKAGEIDLARHLFREAWTIDPTGPDGANAQKLVKACDQQLGLPVEELAPPAPPTPPTPSPALLDPYAAPSLVPSSKLLDPYATPPPVSAKKPSGQSSSLLDPYAASPLDPYATPPASQPARTH